MNLYTLTLWLAGPVIETVILVRAIRANWFFKYKLFSAYVCFVLLQDISFLFIYRSKYYAVVYWWAELLSVVMGLGLTYEIFRSVVGRYPGAGRVARNVLAVVLILTLSKSLLPSLTGSLLLPMSIIDLERDLRVIQAFCLLVLAGMIAYYRIPVGRNARGLLSGYGIFLGTSVVTLTLRSSLGEAFHEAWTSLQPLSYLTVLCIWCVFLWNYEPNPQIEAHPQIEKDYRALATATRKGVAQARGFLARAIRP